jgi:hypothetical protein
VGVSERFGSIGMTSVASGRAGDADFWAFA